MNYAVIVVGLCMACLMSISFSGCLGSDHAGPGTGVPPPGSPKETPVQTGHLVVTEQQNNSTLEVALGSVITVKLPENPTTGYQWNLTTTPGLNVTRDTYIPSSPQLAGSGGIRSWDMATVQEGTQQIRAIYMRSWEPITGNETTFSMTVVVKKG